MHPPTTQGADLLALYLADRDQPCPNCAYNLRALTSATCPECKQRLRLNVALVAPHGLSYALALLGLAACGVAAGFLLAAIGIFSLWWGPPRGEEFACVVLAPAAIAALDGLLVARLGASKARRRFAALSPARRRLAAAGCWGVSLAVFAAWMVAFMALVA